jgi:hypothetical protein
MHLAPAKTQRRTWLVVCLAGYIVVGPSTRAADLMGETATGEAVVLHDDFTWEYSDPEASTAADPAATAVETAPIAPPATPALIGATARKSVPQGCRFGFTLTNRLPDRIKSIVPQFLAFTKNGVMYQRKFQAFSDIRPTMQQYREVQFDGIACDDIEHLQITGAGRCEVGELTKFSASSTQCLAHLEIVDNPLIRVVKSAITQE